MAYYSITNVRLLWWILLRLNLRKKRVYCFSLLSRRYLCMNCMINVSVHKCEMEWWYSGGHQMQEAEQVAARPRNAAAGSAGTWRGFLVTSATILGSASPGHQSPPMASPPSLPPPRLRRLVCFCRRWLLRRSFSTNRFRIIQSTLLSGDGSKLALSLITQGLCFARFSSRWN